MIFERMSHRSCSAYSVCPPHPMPQDYARNVPYNGRSTAERDESADIQEAQAIPQPAPGTLPWATNTLNASISEHSDEDQHAFSSPQIQEEAVLFKVLEEANAEASQNLHRHPPPSDDDRDKTALRKFLNQLSRFKAGAKAWCSRKLQLLVLLLFIALLVGREPVLSALRKLCDKIKWGHKQPTDLKA